MSSASGDANKIIGHVTEATGSVIVVDQDGEQRILKTGDAVYLNEKIITETGASVSIRLTNNRVISLSEQSNLELNDSFREDFVVNAEDNLTDSPETPNEEKTIAEIVQGADSIDVSPASSAGDGSKKAQSDSVPDTLPEAEPNPNPDPNPNEYTITPEMPLVERESDDDDRDLSKGTDYEAPKTIRPEQKASTISSEEVSKNIPVAQPSPEPDSGDDTIPEENRLAVDGNPQLLAVDTSIELLAVNSNTELHTVAGNTNQNSGQLTINLLEHASGVDANDDLYVSRIQLQSGNEAGVNLSLSGNELVIDPQAYKYLAEGEQETLVYEYRVADSEGNYVIQRAEIVISGENDLPTVSSAIVYQGDQNAGSLSVNLLDGASDVDLSDTLNVVSLQHESGNSQGISFDAQANTLEVDSAAYADLAEGETETIKYSYQVDDGQGGQAQQTATVEIEGVNDAPTSQNNQATITEDTPYTFTLTDFPYSDIDNNDQLEYVQISSLPTAGLIFFNGQPIPGGQDISRADIESGLLTFIPEDNASGDDYSHFTFRVSDGDLFSTEQTFSIDLVPVNDAPETANASATIDEDTPYIFAASDFIFSDADAGNEFQGVQITQLPVSGALLFNGSAATAGQDVSKLDLLAGRLKFEPALNESGSQYASFEFKVSDGELLSEAASFGFNVTPINDAPVVSADINEGTSEDISLTLTEAVLLANTSDIDGDALSVNNLRVSSGQVSVIDNGDSTWTITPEANWSGSAKLSFDITDGTAVISSEVNLAIDPVADEPVLMLDGSVIVNDAVPDITPEISAVEDTDFTLDLGASLADTDGSENLNVSVAGIPSGFAISDGSNTITSDGTDIDVTGWNLGNLTLSPVANYNSDFTIAITATSAESVGGDTSGVTRNINVQMQAVNDAAVIGGNDAGSATEDSAGTLSASGTLTASDVDAGESIFTAETITGNYGDLAIAADGSWTYHADNTQSDIQSLADGDTATESLTVRSFDGTVHNIVISIIGVNDAAQITGATSASIIEDIAVNAGNQLLASGQLQVVDVDSGEAFFSPGSVSGSYGSLNIDSGGNWVYTADNTQTAIQSLGNGDQLIETLTVTTLDGSSQDITITINGSNDAAEISGVNAGNVTEDAATQLTTSGQLDITDTDSGEDVFTAESQSGVYGDINIDADGNWTYSADNNQAAIQELDDGETLTDSFTVTSADGTNETIDITLHGENDAPVINNTITDQTVAEEHFFNFQVPDSTFSDIDGDNLTYSAMLSDGSPLPGWLSFDPATRTFSGTPDDPDSGILNVRVMVNDGTTATAAEFSLEVTPVNDPPELQPGNFFIEENSDNGSVLGAVTTNDVDSSSLTYALTDDANGRFVINSSTGEITVADSTGLNYEQDTEHTITVQVSDGQLSDTQSYTVSVLNEVEAPVISSAVEESGTDDSGIMSIDLLENATAVENGETLSVNSLSLTEGDDTGVNFNGTTMTVDASQYAYLPDGVSETIQYSYNVVGSEGEISPQTVTITITGNNEAAQITGIDTASLAEDSTNASGELVATGSLSVSDTDQGEEFFVATDLTGQYGTLSLDENGNWSYTADNTQPAIQELTAGETLEDGFTITSDDGTAHQIVITINGTNDAPQLTTAPADQVTAEEQAFSYQIPTNTFTDVEGETLTYSATLQTGDPLPAWLSFDPATQTFSGTPDDADLGSIDIRVTASDGTDDTSADFSLTVTSVNDTPVVSASINNSTNEDASLTLTNADLLENISDIDGDSLTASNLQVVSGNVSVIDNGNGTWTISPVEHWSGAAQISFDISDGQETVSNTLNLNVDPLADLPVTTVNGNSDQYFVQSPEDTAIALNINIALGDTDGSETLSVVMDLVPAGAVISDGVNTVTSDGSQIDINGWDWANMVLTPPPNQEDDFSVYVIPTATETASGGTAPHPYHIRIDIQPQNDAAVIGGTDTGTVTEDDFNSYGPLGEHELIADGTLTIADIDTEAEFVAETITGTYGELTINTSGQWQYIADSRSSSIQELGVNETLSDVLTVQAADGTTHNITITIQGANDQGDGAPVYLGTLAEDNSLIINESSILNAVNDIDGDTLTVSSINLPAGGHTIVNNNDGTWTLTPAPDFNGLLEMLYVVSDGIQGYEVSDLVRVNVTAVADTAVISGDDSATVTEDAATTLTASGQLNVTDPDAGEAGFTAETINGTYGSLTIDGSGNWTYSADNSQPSIQSLKDGDTVSDVISVSSLDGTTQTITVSINGTSDTAVIGGVTSGAVTEDNSATLSTSGVLTVDDPDAGEAGFIGETLSGNYGSLVIDASGNWNYSANSTQTAIQALGTGDTLAETFTITSLDGTTQNIEITINGTNDAAVIAGTETGTVTEDASSALTTTGSLTISDLDSGEASFTADTVVGSYGSLTIDESGNWSYSAGNSQNAIQSLGDGDQLTDTLTVQSADGTTHNIVITINGTNDAAFISGIETGTVTEDSAGTLTTSGYLDASDADSGEGTFTAETVSGSYGSLTIDASGNWSYSANNSQGAIQALDEGDQLTDTLTVQSVDGTTQTIVITINGTNDTAIIGGTGTGAVTEDSAGTLTTSGALTISDTDTGEAAFSAETITGSYGSLTIDESGNWSYSADNTQTAIQALGTGDTLTDSFTVTSLDGTPQNIEITINGTNDAAFISGIETGTVTEDSAGTLTASGYLDASDADSGEGAFNAETVAGSYGSLTIDESGNWSYSADNTQSTIQSLGDGDQLTDTLTVQSADGTTHNIVITINGTNDAAVISGTETGVVTEDAAGTLATSGALTISDTDSGEGTFIAETVSGGYGSLTIDESGSWSYSADNTQNAIQSLGASDQLTDTLTVQSADGTTHNIVITINGTNDAAVISGTETGVVTEDAAGTLATSGALTISDTDTGEAAFSAETITGSYGSLTIDESGNWSYSADNSQNAIQALGAGDQLTDTLTVQSADGTTHNIVITINGTNDVAVISGTETGAVTEDSAGTLTTSGALTISDTDAGEAAFSAETVSGSYGSLTIDESGNWSYSADNSQSAVQSLGNGDQLTDTLTVQSADGTTHNIVITINGTNDAAFISGLETGTVTEDSAGTLTASGYLDASDADSGEGAFNAETVAGSYGSLTIDESGNWSYSADNSQNAIQSLGAGDQLTDTLTVQSADGTTHNIVITINGTNDAAFISGIETGTVTEDAAGTLTTSGYLDASDADSDEGTFTAQTVSGSYGSLTIDASGNWSYSANNSQGAIQALDEGDQLTDTLTVQSVDGTTQTIVITINGTNDTAIIGGTDTGAVTEDSAGTLTTSGTLTISDTDTGEAAFSAETITGSYGLLTIDESGNWSYSADNTQTAIQALGTGDTLTDSFTVTSLDGTPQNIEITINGTNDVAFISGLETGTVTEDSAGTLTASGYLDASDADSGEGAFNAETVAGSYGSLNH